MTRDEETRALTNALVDQYDEKKWVIDAGALQMINPELFQQNMIITPHAQEFERVFNVKGDLQIAREMSVKHRNITILLKGVEDVVTNGEITEVIEGGNEGMTKGGTGDVLAGLVAAFFCKSGAMESAVAASYLNKRAGDALYAKNGPFFNATDLVSQLPETMRSVLLKDLEG
jgi:NAD(P)H-hydrate epimerase